MSARDDESITVLLTDLVRTLQQLQTEVEPRTQSGAPRPPTLGELIRFTSDVTIPAAILVLRTNIEALQLLRRALRLADGRSTSAEGGSTGVRQRATDLSRVTLARLDHSLSDIQNAVEGTPTDDEARELLAEARQLRADLAAALEAEPSDESGPTIPVVEEETDTDGVAVDVDAELSSLKDELDDSSDDGGPATDADESAAGDGTDGDDGD